MGFTYPKKLQALTVRANILACNRCPLHVGTNPVPFYGPVPAKIAVCGEGPGRQENDEGRPFVGASGKLIRRLLSMEAGVDPEECFWFNTVSHWPKRTKPTHPTPDEIASCRHFFDQQLELASPSIVLVLGAIALHQFRPDLQITKIRGTPFAQFVPTVISGVERRMAFYPTVHPAAALRDPDSKWLLKKDMRAFRKFAVGQLPWPETCYICDGVADLTYDVDGIPTCRKHRTNKRLPANQLVLA